jgi:hypothetical protein
MVVMDVSFFYFSLTKNNIWTSKFSGSIEHRNKKFEKWEFIGVPLIQSTHLYIFIMLQQKYFRKNQTTLLQSIVDLEVRSPYVICFVINKKLCRITRISTHT